MHNFVKVNPSCVVICRDVLPQNFDSYSAEVQKIICTADHLGALMQYDTPGFLPNKRIHRGSADKWLLKNVLCIKKAVRWEFLLCFYSHGFSGAWSHAGHASNMEQFQGASQRKDEANAVERHVRHSCQMEEVRAVPLMMSFFLFSLASTVSIFLMNVKLLLLHMPCHLFISRLCAWDHLHSP